MALPPAPLTNVPGVSALFAYHSPKVHDAVWEIKYRGSRAMAEVCGQLLYDTLVSDLDEARVFERFTDIRLVPMPISDTRRLERGWNQAELLSEALLSHDKGAHFTYAPHLLTKVRHTESQTHTSSKEERLKNLRHSMRAREDILPKTCIVLVDDVYTTGATYNEAKRALQDAGARHVFCITLAH